METNESAANDGKVSDNFLFFEVDDSANLLSRTRSHLYRPGTSKASSRNPPSGPTTPTTSQTPPSVNRKRKKTDSSGPREYDNNDIDVQAVDEPVEQKAEPVELSESSASRKSRKVKRSEMLVPRNAATDSDSDASGFLTREPIPSTSTACKYPQMYTKDVGVQVEECQTLYPVGMLNESHPIKPEASQLFDDMKQRLECPVCCKISLPPVMQCRNGHVTCNNCRLKVRSCPMCREVDIDIRNLFAEKAVSYMTITCEYSHYGCKVEMPFRDRDLVSCSFDMFQSQDFPENYIFEAFFFNIPVKCPRNIFFSRFLNFPGDSAALNVKNR